MLVCYNFIFLMPLMPAFFFFLDGIPEKHTSLHLNPHLIAVLFLIELLLFFYRSLGPYM